MTVAIPFLFYGGSVFLNIDLSVTYCHSNYYLWLNGCMKRLQSDKTIKSERV